MRCRPGPTPNSPPLRWLLRDNLDEILTLIVARHGALAADPSGWVFNVAPYLWLPSIDGSLSYNLPFVLGGSVSANASVSMDDYLPDLTFCGDDRCRGATRPALGSDGLYLHIHRIRSIATYIGEFFRAPPQSDFSFAANRHRHDHEGLHLDAGRGLHGTGGRVGQPRRDCRVSIPEH